MIREPERRINFKWRKKENKKYPYKKSRKINWIKLHGLKGGINGNPGRIKKEE